MSTTDADTRAPLAFPAPLGREGKTDPPKPPSDTEPKRRGRPPGSGSKNSISIARIEEALNEQFTLIGMGVMAFNQYDGRVIIEGAPRLAKALANLCEKNPAVRKNIERMLVGGSYGEIIIAAGLIAVPIMANHDLMPPGVKAMYGQAVPDEADLPEPTEGLIQ